MQGDPTHDDRYREIPSRRCHFVVIEDRSGGIKGLAYAVLLDAVQAGCDSEWLEELAQFYEIDVPKGIFYRQPYARVGVSERTGNRFGVSHAKKAPKAPLLDWQDGLHPQRLRPAHHS